VPYRIYRPGIVVGHSKTGEIDKIDGPYYFFKLIQKFRKALPPWMPTIGIEGGRINIVPVDFVAGAIDHIAHKKGLDGGCFHLTDPDPCAWAGAEPLRSRRAGADDHAAQTRRCSASSVLLVDSVMSSPGPGSLKQGLWFSASKDMFTFVTPTLRSREAEGFSRARASVPRLTRLRLAPVGLLGAPPRPGPLHRPLAPRQGEGRSSW
jgi:hypothetical protein